MLGRGNHLVPFFYSIRVHVKKMVTIFIGVYIQFNSFD